MTLFFRSVASDTISAGKLDVGEHGCRKGYRWGFRWHWMEMEGSTAMP